MSVTGTVNVGGGLYVPYRGVDKYRAAIGTWNVRGTVTGDAGGGFARILLQMSPQQFGFKNVLVLTALRMTDALATPIAIEVGFDVGNERIAIAMPFLTPVGVASSGTNFTQITGSELAIPLEVEFGGALLQSVVEVLWRTNEDGDSYTVHFFGVMYDAEAISKGADWVPDNLFYGIR